MFGLTIILNNIPFLGSSIIGGVSIIGGIVAGVFAASAMPEPASHKNPDVTCPSCGQPFNLTTGAGYRDYGDREGKIQCTNCDNITYIE